MSCARAVYVTRPVPPLASLVAFPLAIACALAALATLGLAAARMAGGPDDDMRAAGRGLVRHGAVVFVLLGSVMAATDHVATVARLGYLLVFATWGAGAIVGGVVLSRRPGARSPRRRTRAAGVAAVATSPTRPRPRGGPSSSATSPRGSAGASASPRTTDAARPAPRRRRPV